MQIVRIVSVRARAEHDPVFTAYVDYVAIPEFPSYAVLPLMIVFTLLLVLYIKRKELSGTRRQTKT